MLSEQWDQVKFKSDRIFFGRESLDIGVDSIVKNEVQILFQFDDFKYKNSLDDFYKEDKGSRALSFSKRRL